MNKCHKPLIRRTHSQKKEKRENVISVVKASKDMSLVELSAVEEKGDLGVENEVSRSRARSRSRRRAW